MVVVATPVVDDVLKDLARADVDPVVVDDDVNELFVVDELFVVVLSDADLVVSHLVDVVVAYLKTFVVKLLDVELYLFVVLTFLVIVVNLFVVNLYLYVVD